MDQLNSKVLESLMIPRKNIDINIKDYEIKNKKVNFFGSNWSTDVYFDLPENRLEEGKKALISFLKKSSSISSKIENWLELMENTFGKGNFFLEMQPSPDKDQMYVNKKILFLSKSLNIPADS